ncbi:MAG: hypothetical protein AB7S26_26575 [Sandaracinaceae bacterium]
MTDVPTSVSRFHEAMRAALLGEIGPAELEQRAGGPSSSRSRLGLVVRMVHAGHRSLIERAYPATRRAAAGAFDDAVRTHLARLRGSERDYPALALGFPDALEQTWADPRCVELADWEESLHRLRVVGAPTPHTCERGPVLARQYTFDAPRCAAALRTDEGDEARSPADWPEAMTFVLLHRDPDRGRPMWFAPSAHHLAALAVARGEMSPTAAAAAMGATALRDAHDDLVARGVLRGVSR